MNEFPAHEDGQMSSDHDIAIGGDQNGRYRRRALMLGAAAGVGAVASLVGSAGAEATEGDPLLAGKTNTAAGTTALTTTAGTRVQGTTSGGDQSGVAGIDNGIDNSASASSFPRGMGVLGAQQRCPRPGASRPANCSEPPWAE
jgi:hypothetical protein